MISNSTDLGFAPPTPPPGPSRGVIHYAPRSILHYAGSPRAYQPGRHPPGTRIKFRAGQDYLVMADGRLRGLTIRS